MKNKILYWFILKLILPKYIKDIKIASEIYAIHQWYKQYPGEDYITSGCYKKEFCNIQFSFIDGYSKALYDNGLKFKDCKVIKDIERFV